MAKAKKENLNVEVKEKTTTEKAKKDVVLINATQRSFNGVKPGQKLLVKEEFVEYHLENGFERLNVVIEAKKDEELDELEKLDEELQAQQLQQAENEKQALEQAKLDKNYMENQTNDEEIIDEEEKKDETEDNLEDLEKDLENQTK